MDTRSGLNRCALASATLICALLGHTQVRAEALATATIGAYQYTLTDLAPDDGVDASITWGTGQVAQNLGGSLSDGVGDGGGLNTVDSKSLSQTLPLPLAGTPALNYAGYSVSSTQTGSTVTADVSNGGLWNLNSVLTQGFTLGANTAVTFTALAQTSLGVTVPHGSVVTRPSGYEDNGYFDWAPLQAGSNVVLFIGNVPEYSEYATHCNSGCLSADSLTTRLRTYSTTTQAQDKLLQVTLSNASSSTLSSQIGRLAYTGGYAAAPISMVPEPSTFRLALAGLAGLRLAKRAGRRHQSSAHGLAPRV